MRIVRLNSDDRFQQILREGREHSRAPILNRASVTDGQTSFNGNESLVVTGSQKVTGWLIVTGTLKGVGTLLWEQVVNFTGAFTSTGPTKLNGPTEITQTLDVSATTTLRGALSLLADLVVSAGGKITVGGLTIDPAAGGQIIIAGDTAMVIGNDGDEAAVTFSTGGQLAGRPSGVVLRNAAQTASVGATTEAYLLAGSKSVRVSASGIQLLGLPNVPAGTTVYAVVADSSGNLYRSSSSV